MSNTIQSTSGTIRYRLKDIKSNAETSIILDYSFVRKNRLKFAAGYKVRPSNWDNVNQRIKAISTLRNRERVNSDFVSFPYFELFVNPNIKFFPF